MERMNGPWSISESFREALVAGYGGISEFLSDLWHDEVLELEGVKHLQNTHEIVVKIKHADYKRTKSIWKCGPIGTYKSPICESTLRISHVDSCGIPNIALEGTMVNKVDVADHQFIVVFDNESLLTVRGQLEYELSTKDIPELERRITSLGLVEWTYNRRKPNESV